MSLIQCHFDDACSFWFTGLSKKWKQEHVYTIHNNLAPSYLHENFVQQNTVHLYKTRFSSDGC